MKNVGQNTDVFFKNSIPHHLNIFSCVFMFKKKKKNLWLGVLPFKISVGREVALEGGGRRGGGRMQTTVIEQQ